MQVALNLEPIQVAFFLAGEITQVKESIPWVRCASGNVFYLPSVSVVPSPRDLLHRLLPPPRPPPRLPLCLHGGCCEDSYQSLNKVIYMP